jgi:hypothetical protein
MDSTVAVLSPRHGPATPVRHRRRFGLQGGLHDGGNLASRCEIEAAREGWGSTYRLSHFAGQVTER